MAWLTSALPGRRRLRRPTVSSGCFMQCCSQRMWAKIIIENIARCPVPGCAFCVLRDDLFCVGMPLSDMPMRLYAFIRYARVGVACERAARCGRARHRLRKVVGSRTHLRELLAHAGFDMRILRAGAPRRGQCEFARYAPCMLERRLRIRIVQASRRIVNSKYLEGRLIHQDL